jgi:hypothetical protein
MTINKKNKFILVNKSITNHLGKNPKKGGSPPKERRGIKITVFIRYLKLKDEKIWFKLKIFNLLKRKITVIDKKQ